MKIFVPLCLFLFSLQALAEEYYCKLENVPAVKQAIQKELDKLGHSSSTSSGKFGIYKKEAQFTVKGMGDAFDFWGSDVLVFSLDDLGPNNQLSVAVKVSYASFYASEYAASEADEGHPVEELVCVDENISNPEIIYIDNSEADFPITAEGFNLY